LARLRLALLQLASHGRELAANLEKGERACREAAARGAELALFPEMWSIGYRGFDPADAADRRAWEGLALTRDDARVARFGALARELGLAVAFTYLERTPAGPRNAAALFDAGGRGVLDYAKVHLGPWNPPDDACVPGDEFPVAALETRAGLVQVGAMICFDREFPESARMLMLNGAELVIVPNACPLDDRAAGIGDVRIAQLRGRAFENLVAVAMANYAAPDQDGRSCAFQADGGRLALAGEAEEIVLVDLDLARLHAFRREHGDRDDPRRPEVYAPLADPGAPRPLREARRG
jgi:predicted amidohydrolase